MDKKLYIHPPLVSRSYDWEGGPQPKTRKELDKFFVSPAIEKVKSQICEMGRRIYARGYTDGNGGNISVRVGQDLVLCTPTLCSKGFMEPKDICLVDMEAGQLCGASSAASEKSLFILLKVSLILLLPTPPELAVETCFRLQSYDIFSEIATKKG